MSESVETVPPSSAKRSAFIFNFAPMRVQTALLPRPYFGFLQGRPLLQVCQHVANRARTPGRCWKLAGSLKALFKVSLSFCEFPHLPVEMHVPQCRLPAHPLLLSGHLGGPRIRCSCNPGKSLCTDCSRSTLLGPWRGGSGCLVALLRLDSLLSAPAPSNLPSVAC